MTSTSTSPSTSTRARTGTGTRVLEIVGLWWGWMLVLGMGLSLLEGRGWRFGWVGLGLMGLGLLVGLWGLASLGQGGLVMTGAYARVRNPLGICALLLAVGLGVARGSWLVLAATVIGLAMHRIFVQPSEDPGMRQEFGEAFELYRRRVRRWRPRLRAYVAADESREPALATERTTPPGRWIALYDGHCKFCTAQAKNLLRVAPTGTIELSSFQDSGVLDAFPGVTYDACMRSMHLIAPDGRVYEGAEAIMQAVARRGLLLPLARLYYLPGLRLLADSVYALVAANRYRLMGKAVATGECSDACAVHIGSKKPATKP
ncbi:MAG: DUF393 domain-containing protein [Deltaproteobacteria bacterium]|nr:DUF393 domain-containing protein [Deltaproteobacteria bacterium]